MLKKKIKYYAALALGIAITNGLMVASGWHPTIKGGALTQIAFLIVSFLITMAVCCTTFFVKYITKKGKSLELKFDLLVALAIMLTATAVSIGLAVAANA